MPWPEKSDSTLYQPAMPARYKVVTEGLGIVGAIAIEASPLKSDNDWLLQTAKDNPFIVGIVGDLVPDAADFGTDLERLHRNALFLGIRYGNLWHRSLATDIVRPGFLDGLKLLAQTGLVLESANPDLQLLAALAQVNDRLPDLTIVIDHLPQAVELASSEEQGQYRDIMTRLSASPRVFVKLSEIPVKQSGVVPVDIKFYRSHLDALWDQFGSRRLIYGSDWPNSDHMLPFTTTFKLVQAYMHQKSAGAQEDVYRRNSQRAYRWAARIKG